LWPSSQNAASRTLNSSWAITMVPTDVLALALIPAVSFDFPTSAEQGAQPAVTDSFTSPSVTVSTLWQVLFYAKIHLDGTQLLPIPTYPIARTNFPTHNRLYLMHHCQTCSFNSCLLSIYCGWGTIVKTGALGKSNFLYSTTLKHRLCKPESQLSQGQLQNFSESRFPHLKIGLITALNW
jgi:hypothetical protein